jgi:hypothetical protein
VNPQELFCPNIACRARGQVGKGNIHIHSQKNKRCICEVCGQTFTTTTGTIFYRLRSDPQLVMWVIVLLAYGCPIQATLAPHFGAVQVLSKPLGWMNERLVIGRGEQVSIVTRSMKIWLKTVSMIYNKCKPMTLAPHASAGESK